MLKNAFHFGLFLLLITLSGSAFAVPGDIPRSIATHIELTTLPESGGLVVLGSLLISGATVLRRKWSTRNR